MFGGEKEIFPEATMSSIAENEIFKSCSVADHG